MGGVGRLLWFRGTRRIDRGDGSMSVQFVHQYLKEM
jgi:hypothetical protein